MFKKAVVALLLSTLFLFGCEAEKTEIFPNKAPERSEPGIEFTMESDEHGNIRRFETRVNGDQVTTTEITRPPQECIDQSNSYIQKYSPTGTKVFNMMPKKEDFEIWYNCSDHETSKITYLSTAIHESVHALTAETNQYPQLNGKHLPKFDDEGLPPPNKVRHLFPRDDDLVKTYLTPGAESATSNELFSYLLDELNAYTFDLKSIMELLPVDPDIKNSSNQFRDGTAGLMSFAAAHLNAMKKTRHWGAFERQKHIIVPIWIQAENVLNEACKYPYLGGSEEHYLKVLRAQQDGINELLGRRIRINC